jgi:SSS family solute:Na+ symporter
LAAKDSKTGRQVYTRTSFFFVCRFVLPGLWGIAALRFLAGREPAHALHAMPQFLAEFVPIGLMGLLVAAMLAAEMSTDSSYMLTWASVIYNDLLAPWHRGKWSDATGLRCSRLIVAAIGAFLLIYGLWYPMQSSIWEYLAVTGTIYLASISTLLVACCYWRAANDWGAFAAIIVGAILPTSFLVLQQVEATREITKSIGPYHSGIAAYVGAAIAMVVGSLLKSAFHPANQKSY